ncbi:MAG: hypothetical protein ACYC2T_06895 [Bacillota bacterium]
MRGSSLVRMVEDKFSRRPPDTNYDPPRERQTFSRPLPDGAAVIIIGGGIAGSAFARQLFVLAHQEKRHVKVYMVNSTNCNYCGGLVTNLALETMSSLYGWDVPSDLVLKRVDRCTYINTAGSSLVQVDIPLTATLRTSRFGIPGFDDSLKSRILEGLPPEYADQYVDIEPTIATRIIPPADQGGKWQVVLSKLRPDKTHEVIEGDVVVVACGFKSLNRPMLDDFQKATGYIPPSVMAAAVTEVDTSKARYNHLGNRMYILDGIMPGVVLAFIPKGQNWLTLTALGRKLSTEDIKELFDHPEVKKFIDIPDASQCLRCHTVCGATVFTDRPARNFYGDGWLVIGDLTGHGRVLKDGYFAAFLGARLAAATILHHGANKESLKRFYHHPLKYFPSDNRVGMLLFHLNIKLIQKGWFSRLMINAAQSEEEKSMMGRLVHGGIRALVTGELSYRWIAALFVLGLIGYILLHPWQALRCFLPEKSKNNASGKTTLGA